jgi:hypothetical protein
VRERETEFCSAAWASARRVEDGDGAHALVLTPAANQCFHRSLSPSSGSRASVWLRAQQAARLTTSRRR